MLIRKMNLDDLDQVLYITKKAKEYFKNNNIDQWQDNYPNRNTFLNDIKENRAYVLIDDNKIQSFATIGFEKEDDYENIYEGKWQFSGEYITIHRICTRINTKRNGYASKIIEYFFEIAKRRNIDIARIDTHQDNHIMRNFIIKHGFREAGIVYIRKTEKRIAYEKKLIY